MEEWKNQSGGLISAMDVDFRIWIGSIGLEDETSQYEVRVA
jgi:hypothetical protein